MAKSFQEILKEETPNFARKRIVPRPKGVSANKKDTYGDATTLAIENVRVGRARWPKTRYKRDPVRGRAR